MKEERGVCLFPDILAQGVRLPTLTDRWTAESRVETTRPLSAWVDSHTPSLWRAGLRDWCKGWLQSNLSLALSTEHQ